MRLNLVALELLDDLMVLDGIKGGAKINEEESGVVSEGVEIIVDDRSGERPPFYLCPSFVCMWTSDNNLPSELPPTAAAAVSQNMDQVALWVI